jgi:hypothetical protein
VRDLGCGQWAESDRDKNCLPTKIGTATLEYVTRQCTCTFTAVTSSSALVVFPLNRSFSVNPMSPPQSTLTASSSSPNCRFVLNAALEAYEKTTKNKLLNHPFATQLQSCDTPSSMLSVLMDLVQQFEQNRAGDERLRTWLEPTVNVLFAFSAALGEGVSLVLLKITISREFAL